MHWLWLLGCGTTTPTETPEPVAPVTEPAAPAPGAPAAQPADAVLDRHNTVTKQCGILERATWRLAFEARSNDGHATTTESKIRYQGRTGLSFSRLQQQTKPMMRFVAFGRTPEGQFCSAGDQGVQSDLPEAATASIASAIDPTPLCAYAKRWPTREIGGEEQYEGELATRVELKWVDGAVTQMWFSKEKGTLLGSRSEAGETVTQSKLYSYAEHKGILWPGREVGITEAGPVKVTTEQLLTEFSLDPKDFGEIGPEAIGRIIQSAKAPPATP